MHGSHPVASDTVHLSFVIIMTHMIRKLISYYVNDTCNETKFPFVASHLSLWVIMSGNNVPVYWHSPNIMMV